MEKKKVILDCDNTFGLAHCDVDDGLALLYLLGSENADLMGISCTYGNSDVETVFRNTKCMLKDIGEINIPITKGCDGSKQTRSDAALFLMDMINAHPGEISLLMTGSLTNIYDAFLLDANLFTKTKEIVLMGGITEPLMLNGVPLEELNFSCDPRAAYTVMKHSNNLSIITGNNCLQVLFKKKSYEKWLGQTDTPVAQYIYQKTAHWYREMEKYALDGFYNWDVFAAAYLLDRQLFDENPTDISPTEDSLKMGKLLANGDKIRVKLPLVLYPEHFEKHVYSRYLKTKI